MKKKLPVMGKPTPAQAQKGLAATPVKGASRPEFPTRSEAYLKAGLLGGAALIAGCGSPSHAHTTPPPAPVAIAPAPAPEATPAPAPAPPPTNELAAPPESKPAPPPPQAAQPPPPPQNPPVDPKLLADGSVDGQPLAKQTPKFKVYREGGGIGPAEDMWEPSEVEAYLSWQMAKEGKLNLKSHYKLEYDGVSLDVDGFDPDKNVGYVYVDKFEDASVITKDVRDKLDGWMKAKKAAILLIEVKKVPDAATLKGKIMKFMAGVKKAPPNAGPLG